MGLFGRKNARGKLADAGFTVTKTILEPPKLSLLPALYQDEFARRWAVSFPGADPVVFSYDDIVACEVVEAGAGVKASPSASGADLARKIIANPSAVSRENAARRKDFCLGLGVVVAVRTGENEPSQLQIPVLTHEMKRGTRGFEQMMGIARSLKADIDAMREAGQG